MNGPLALGLLLGVPVFMATGTKDAFLAVVLGWLAARLIA